MNRPILACAFFGLATAALVAQDQSQSSPYQGTSNPPPDDTIITTEQQAPIAKPPAAHPMQQAPAPTAQATAATQGTRPVPQTYGDGTDDGIVGVAPGSPTLTTRASAADPDDDIVHPAPLPPGTLGEGTLSRVASDVLQDGQVVIPAGAEIDGHVAELSTGHFGGHGSILLHPETITMENGSKFQLRAVVISTPGSNLRVGSEGVITPGSRVKRNSIEYGAVAGGGAVIGAILGGPPGMLAGGMIGAGVVTTHLLVSHPQAKIEEGAVLMLTLTDQVRLVPAATQGN